MSGLIIFMHRGNIKRLLNGTESKLSFKKKALMEEDDEIKPSAPGMAEFFDGLAEEWDPRECDAGTRDKIAALAGFREGSVIADIGCGRGVMSPHLLAANPDKVIGIDLSPEMIRLAKRDHVNPQLEYICGDALELDLPVFDAAIIYNAYPHFLDKEALAFRAAELVKPGGIFVIAHGRGRGDINANHSGCASALSAPLLSAEEEAAHFSEYFSVVTSIDAEEMYFIKFERKQPL